MTAEEKLAQEFNTVAFKFGASVSMKVLTPKKEKELASDVRAVDQLVHAKRVLCSSLCAENDEVSLSLDLPITKLEAAFVKKMDALLRRPKFKKINKRIKLALQL